MIYSHPLQSYTIQTISKTQKFNIILTLWICKFCAVDLVINIKAVDITGLLLEAPEELKVVLSK